MNALETYLQAFAKLNRSPGTMWPTETLHKAPHKPLFLLALIDFADQKPLEKPFVDTEDDLRALDELFTYYWRRVFEWKRTSSVAFPFSHLHNEPLGYWRLVPLPGESITPAIINNTTASSKLKSYCLGAQLSPEFHLLLQDPSARSALREILLQSHFTPEAAQALRDQAAVNAQAWDYSQELIQKAHQPLIKKVVEKQAEYAPYRCQGFRIAIAQLYENRCAFCGIRVLTLDGHTLVEAAHIIPWCETNDDDPRNGLALCRTCHWAFDEGMTGVKEDYSIRVSKQVQLIQNLPGYLTTLTDRKLSLPADDKAWPLVNNLAWHSREVFIA